MRFTPLHNDASIESWLYKINDGIVSSPGEPHGLRISAAFRAMVPLHQKGLDAIREAVRIIADLDYIDQAKNQSVQPCGLWLRNDTWR